MADRMRPVPFAELLRRTAGEYREHGSIFGIDKKLFYADTGNRKLKVFDQSCSTPVGPAAGPHTQLAGNLIASYVAGARFMELKTCQILDTIEVAKPCIDARDECFNVEWSTEFTLEKAFDEYLKAWIILHILEGCVKGHVPSEPSFIFNMSVGYTLDGIKTEKMQKYINSMLHAPDEVFSRYLSEARDVLLKEEVFKGTDWEENAVTVASELGNISQHITDAVTISTMHGCPPHEIEAICTYMLTEKNINTLVKLNPTLLGYDRVRKILDDHGFSYVALKRSSFEHDLQLADAFAMLHRLLKLASEKGRHFGVKLTNTLGTANDGKVLPGDEMYMSGRSLYPLSLGVARVLSEEFEGKLPISYSGGVSIHNAAGLLEAGIHPLTIATDMLKPGGYMRMTQVCDYLRNAPGWETETISVEKLAALEKSAEKDKTLLKSTRGTFNTKIGDELELLDCFAAPCVEACPIHQDIPDYISLAGEGRWAEALGVIYLKNALPNLLGYLCDHQCQRHCARMDYECPVEIREIKKLAAAKGREEFLSEIFETPGEPADVKAAVLGSGPAGLSSAYFLRRAGFDTTIFEKTDKLGGMALNMMRQPAAAAAFQNDISFVLAQGVAVEYNAAETVSSLKEKGYDYVFVTAETEKAGRSGIKGNSPVESAFSFLMRATRDEEAELGSRTVVAGDGTTTEAAVRKAQELSDSVTVLLQGTGEGIERLDGVTYITGAKPLSFQDWVLSYAKDGETLEIEADYVLSANGEKIDPVVVSALSGGEEHVYVVGDTTTSGSSLLVKCVAGAHEAVDEAIEEVLSEREDDDEDECCCHHHGHCCEDEEEEDGCCCHHHDDDEDECCCHHHHDEEDDCCSCHDEEELSDEDLRAAEDKFFEHINYKKSRITEPVAKTDESFAAVEASRCMECNYVCMKCVDVCPNRANAIIDLRDTGLFDDPFQILHIDAYCNECGNCETFCPHNGGPYRKKFTVFSLMDDFVNSSNEGFLYQDEVLTVRLDGEVITARIVDGEVEGGLPEEIKAFIAKVFSSYSYLLGPVEE